MRTMEATRLHRVTGLIKRVPILAWQGLNQLLWPAVCVNCGQGISADDRHLCRTCWDQLLTCTAGDYCPRCGRDATRYGLVAGTCPACQGLDIHFDGIARVGVNTEALQRMILAFKHDRTELAPLLAGA